MKENTRDRRVFVSTFIVALCVLCSIFMLSQYRIDTETVPQSVNKSPAFSEPLHTKYILKVKVRRKIITGLLDLMAAIASSRVA